MSNSSTDRGLCKSYKDFSTSFIPYARNHCALEDSGLQIEYLRQGQNRHNGIPRIRGHIAGISNSLGNIICRISLTLIFVLCSFNLVTAQFYPTQHRPPQAWQQLQTPHFKLIFPEGTDSSAVQMGRILEEQYPLAQKLVGGELHNFPVILNDYNDRSNGFVTPFHFRSEIELPPIKGKSLNPQSGNWLETVGPHELVHALQFSNLGGYNFPAFVSLFAPDLARAFHGAIPSGITEGLAVHHETQQVAPRGGRGHYPFFTNQFKAIFQSNQRWSMGQMVQTSSNTRPFNRHYIGGYAFTSWLQDTFGSNTTRKALDFYMDFPFLGYGVALRHVTGFWPGQLYSHFETDHQKMSASHPPSLNNQTLNIPYKGRDIRRPKWLSDSTLIFYGSFYNARSGFYRYNLQTKTINRLVTTNSVGDYRYDLSDDRKTLVYSYYQTHTLYDNTYKTELMKVDIGTGHQQQLTQNGRLYAPVYLKTDRLLALQMRPASSALVSLSSQSSTSNISSELTLGNHEITAVAVHPADSVLAIVANKRGLQGLWIVDRNKPGTIKYHPPDISFQEGSVFDPVWHPNGEKLIFSSDFTGTHQLYEFNRKKGTVRQLTHAAFNAFEGAYSPDGKRLAFIKQLKNERLPTVINISDTVGSAIDPSLWKPTKAKSSFMRRPVVADSLIGSSRSWKIKPFQPGLGWLKPRALLPVVNFFSAVDSYQLGMSLHSNNVLQNQAYSAAFSYLEDRLWYDISYQNKQFFPGFKLRLYSDPSFLSFDQSQPDSPGTLLRQKRDVALSIPFDLQLNQNIYSTSLTVDPEIRYSQIRFMETGAQPEISDFTHTAVSNLYAQFNFRLQQNIRDIQPNSGLILFSELEHYWGGSDLEFSFAGRQLNLSLRQSTAYKGGVYGYFSPLRRWNQSLQIGIEGLSQSGLVFDTQSLISDGFSEPVLARSNNLLSFNARYTIPLYFADDGGFLLPFYLNNIYLAAFSNTVTNPGYSNWYEQSRTVFGLELHTQFRLSNLAFDIGIGLGFEPTRGNHQFFIKSF